MRPTFQILTGGNDITADISARFISLDSSDGVDESSDGITIVLEDAQGTLAVPASGAKLEVLLGYNGDNQSIGTFVVYEVTIEGPPDIVTIQASATPFVTDRGGGGNSSFTSRKSRSFEGKTLGDIVKTIASEGGLAASISADLAAIQIPHIAQINESSANMLLRLARRFGAFIKLSDGRLVVAAEGGGKTVSGEDLAMTLTPADVSSWAITLGGKSQGVTAVKVNMHNYDTGETEEIVEPVADPQFAQPPEDDE
jgi:uncharacterized protein